MSVFVAAVLIGLASGVSPGPMFVLVVSASLRHGLVAGIRMAMVPLVSDFPILAVVFGVFAGTNVNSRWLGVLAMGGALYLGWLAIKELKGQHPKIDRDSASVISLTDAVSINLMNPHPWMFWFGVGGPIVVAEAANWAGRGIVFVCGFYFGLVGVKICLAWLIARTRHGLSERGHWLILRAAAIALLVLAIVLLWESYGLLTSN